VPGLPDGPGFPEQEARAVSATCDGVRIWSVYVPNGREPDSDHYRYKLEWLAALREDVAAGPDAVMVCGDMNIAPTDADVFDPAAYEGHTHVTPPERAALAELEAIGLHDVVRDRWPDTQRVFSYWDYRAGMFHKDLGMRIDLILAGAPVAARVEAAWIDRKARKGKGPSDHAPVIVDLDEAPDGDIGPVVPPPSRPVTTRGAAKLPQSRD
jgi:exodeoxyribonuclease-3